MLSLFFPRSHGHFRVLPSKPWMLLSTRKPLFSKRNCLTTLSLLPCHFASCISYQELSQAQRHRSRTEKVTCTVASMRDSWLLVTSACWKQRAPTPAASMGYGWASPVLKQTPGSVKATGKCKEDLGGEEGRSKNVRKGVNWVDVWLSPCHTCISCFRVDVNPKAASGSTPAWAEVGLDSSEVVLFLFLICHNKQPQPWERKDIKITLFDDQAVPHVTAITWEHQG